jgi:RNA polymerase sigma factor (sigma-70 family)
MDREQLQPSAAELVSNLAWVQRLALSLARNPDAADDLTQEVARVWLEQQKGQTDEPRSLRAWLAAVTRNLARDRARSDRARRAREQSVARRESEGDSYEVVERGEWQKRVTEAVMELDEPYRSTILYCYLDQLPKRAVAERMGVSEAAVRKRVERGLALLRVRLGGVSDEPHGARALLVAWLGPLMTKGKSLETLWTAVRAKFAGVLLMTMNVKVAVTAIAVGLVLFFAWRALPESSERSPADAVATTEPSAPSEVAPRAVVTRTNDDAEHASDASTADREAVSVPSPPTTGSLLLHVVWGEDKTPAPGVLFALQRDGGDPLFDEPFATSDGNGALRFDALRPGRVRARIERGGMDWSGEIEIEAGKETESTFEVPLGMDCKVVVVDRKDRPIESAEVLVAGWGETQAFTLARTGADGTASLHALGASCHIGARAAGYAVSPLRGFTVSKGTNTEVRIVLGDPAAELEGVVLDPSGHPAVGAVVQAGVESLRGEKLPDGSFIKSPTPVRTRTDAGGRFAFQSLSPGTLPLFARTPGLAPSSQQIELLAGKTKTVTIALEPGVTVIGTVRDSAGLEIAQAKIEIGEWLDFAYRTALSDSRGEFRIEGTGGGELKLRAEREGKGTANTTLRASPGETVRWDAVLSSGVSLHGLVLDAEGNPVKRVSVMAELMHGSRDVHWLGQEGTDDAGRFVLKNCIAGETLRISVDRKGTFPEVTLQDVLPSDDELVIHLPKEAWVYIQGKILDPDDEPIANVHVSLSMKGERGSTVDSADSKSGAFRYGPYPPGEYRLDLRAEGYPAIVLPWRALGPDETWDVGTLKFWRGGSVLLNLVSSGTEPVPSDIGLEILDASGEFVCRVELTHGIGRSGPLAPGSYLVRISGQNLACRFEPFEVRAGVELPLDVRIQRGVKVEIDSSVPDGEAGKGDARLVIRDASGTVVMRGEMRMNAGSLKTSTCLSPGAYQVDVSKGALLGAQSFSVAGDGSTASVKVSLHP